MKKLLEEFKALLEEQPRGISTTMAFTRALNILLKDKNIGKTIVPMIADEAELIGANVTYKFYDNGMNKELEISPGRENMVYKYMGKENKIGVARAAVIKYYPEFLIQTQKALQNACLLRDKASGKLEAEETAKAREKLGIRIGDSISTLSYTINLFIVFAGL